MASLNVEVRNKNFDLYKTGKKKSLKLQRYTYLIYNNFVQFGTLKSWLMLFCIILIKFETFFYFYVFSNENAIFIFQCLYFLIITFILVKKQKNAENVFDFKMAVLRPDSTNSDLLYD